MERLTERIGECVQCNDRDCRLSYCDRSCGQYALMVQKLADYEDKQEQGLLKILPCPIGTMVHEPYKFCGDGAWEIDHHYLKLEDLDKIGKTVFVDENDAKAYIAEAEEALAKMGGKE